MTSRSSAKDRSAFDMKKTTNNLVTVPDEKYNITIIFFF